MPILSFVQVFDIPHRYLVAIFINPTLLTKLNGKMQRNTARLFSWLLYYILVFPILGAFLLKKIMPLAVAVGW